MPIQFAPDLDPGQRRALGYDDARSALLDPRGWTVRCTPRRRTCILPLPNGRVVFRKHHAGPTARLEWSRLHDLDRCGLRVAAPLFVAWERGPSVIGIDRAPGWPIDVLLAEAVADPDSEACRAAADCCALVVAPMVRRLHDLGWVYRDLYWNHLFAERLEPVAAEPVLIDAQRAFRPRWRRRRWRIKDLAGLAASMPGPLGRPITRRLLAAYGRGDEGAAALADAVLTKAARIRRHRPRYG